MFPQQQPSTHWTFDPVHRENKNEFNKFEIASFDDKIKAEQRRGFEYGPLEFQTQWRWLQDNFYKTTGNGGRTIPFKIMVGDEPDIPTNLQDVHAAAQRRFDNNLHPIIREFAVHYLNVCAGKKYLPYTDEPFVALDFSLFRNTYKPSKFQKNGMQYQRPEIYQEFLDRLMPSDKTCVIASGTTIRQQDYFDEYISHLIQKPAEPNTVAILLRGDKGTGKGFWQDVMMKKLLGSTNYKAVSLKEAKGQFIKSLYHSTLLHIEEANDNRPDTLEQLKRLITQEYAQVQEKYVPVSEQQKYFRLILTSNFTDPVKIEQNDRRFFVPCFSEHLHSPTESQQFFSRFEYWLEEEGGYQTMLNYYHTLDIDGISFRHPPMTSEKLELTEQQPASEQKVENASMILAQRFRDYGFKTIEVSKHWGITEPDARRALELAGFKKYKRNWVKGLGKSYWLYIHKSKHPDNKHEITLFESRNLQIPVTLRPE